MIHRSLIYTTIFLLAVISLSQASQQNTIIPEEKASYYADVEAAKILYADNRPLNAEQLALLKHEGIITPWTDELDRTGGPDEFGYMFYDSDEENGPEFNWIDIREDGTQINGMGDDTNLGPFEIGFDFPYYGQTYDQFWACSNGWITFSANQGAAYTNQPIPSAGIPNNMIAPCWDDLYPPETGEYYYGEDENGNMVIQFENVSHINRTGAVTMEIILYQNGDILFQYQDITFQANSTTIGIENSGGTDGLQYVYNGAPEDAPWEELAILFTMGEENASLSGIVIDACSGEPVPDVNIEVGNYDTVTDENGEYLIEEMYPRTYTVRAFSENYAEYEEAGVVIDEGENTFDIALDPFPMISVDPEALNFEVDWNGQDSDIISVSNVAECADNLNFSVHITYLDEEFAAMQQFRDRILHNAAQIPASLGGGEHTGPFTYDLDAFPVQPTSPRYSELDDPYFLIFQDNDPWGGRNGHQDLLAELDIPFDLVGSGNMADQDLGDYTVILIPSCQSQVFYNTLEDNNDRWEEWVGNGGWWEMHGCVQSPQVWELWDGLSMIYGTSNTNFVLEPDHPIMEGINPQIQGGAASHCYMVNLPEDAVTIMDNTMDMPVLIEYPYGRGNVLATTQTWEFYYPQRNPANCGEVMYNAMIYTSTNAGGAGSWLTVDPDDGSVEVDQTVDLDVQADAEAAELLEGIYEAIVEISSNDPENPVENVWITLIVGSPGVLQGNVTDAETGDPLVGAEVTAWEDGEYLRSVFTNEDGFYTMSLEEGTWSISADAEDYYAGDMVEVDIVEGDTTIQDLELFHEIPPDITVDPEFFQFEIEWGEQDSDILTVGNAGGLPLNYSIAVTYLEDEMQMGNQRRYNQRNLSVQDLAGIICRGDGMNSRSGILPGFAPEAADLISPYQLNLPKKRIRRYSELDETGLIAITASNDARILQSENPQLEATLEEWGYDWMYINSVAEAVEAEAEVIIGRFGGIDLANDIRNSNWIEDGHGYIQNGDWINWFPDSFMGLNNQPVTMQIVDDQHPVTSGLPETWETGGYWHYALSGYMGWVTDATFTNLASGTGNGNQQQRVVTADPVGDGYAVYIGSLMYGEDAPEASLQLFRNALMYARTGNVHFGWLTVEPTDGTIDIDEETELELSVDAEPDSLFAGTYEALIEISGDHPETETEVVWVTLIVNGGPPHHQFIPLHRNYFELISSRLDPVRFGNDAADVFGDLEALDIVYRDDGGIFIPDQINTIGEVSPLEGYRIFVEENSELHIQGDIIDPASEYEITGNVYNWIGYPYNVDVAVDQALSSISDDLVIVLNDEGELWIPDLINTMGNMTPGEGYIVLTTSDVTLVYQGGEMMRALPEEYTQPPIVEDAPIPTGLPYAVLVEFEEPAMALEPTFVELYDGNRLVGKSAVLENEPLTPVIAWGGSPDHSLEGFVEGHPIDVVVKGADGEIISLELTGNTAFYGKAPYTVLTLGEADLPAEFSVGNGYPNPFNPSITIPFATPVRGDVQLAVYNVLGRVVYQDVMRVQPGYHKIEFNSSNHSVELASGVYFLQLGFQGETAGQKIVLLK